LRESKQELWVNIVYKEDSYKIMGACFEVYNEKGFGFHEAVYQECMELELGFQSIPFQSQQELKLNYTGHALKQKYIPDILCFDTIVVELKAVSALTDEHRGQVLNYLRATGMNLGLLINFGTPKKLEWERIVLT
jgi:GxxExxY protein